jgi:hypothetical protein
MTPLAEDTLTQLRTSLRKLLVALDQDDRLLARKVRVALLRDDDYATPGKPPCDWDDRSAREVLVDALVTDCIGALEVLCDHELTGPSQVAAELVGLVAGQDVAQDGDGIFRSVQGVAKDRLISTVDTEASHGNQPVILGDCAYADGTTRTALSGKDFTLMAKCPPIRSVTGGFTKERFAIDLEQRTVTCPAGQVVIITSRPDGGGIARFGSHCASCSLRSACTRSRAGCSVAINQHEAITQIARTEQRDPVWLCTYRANRPHVERKIAHLVRRGWGGRRARTRGLRRGATDLDTRASAINWARLATLGLTFGPQGWSLAGG